MTFVQAMVLALLQGVSELFPISSLGHTVIVPSFLHWSIDRKAPSFLSFVVALHLGTATALVVFYRHEWRRIVAALWASVVRGSVSNDPDERLGWLLVIGTVPVGILGVLFEKAVKSLFGSTLLVGVFLVVNAFVMFLGESLRRAERPADGRPARPLTALSWIDGAKIGLAQALALLPGISRSGVSIVAGLLLDLDHDDAAKYSFMLATPVIGAAALLELPRLFAAGSHGVLAESLLGGVLAGITAYASVAFLTRYFHSNDLRPFGWYCLIVGGLAVALAAMKVVA